MRHYNIPIFIPHLGCPYDCIYCDQKKISAQMRIPETAEVSHIIEQHVTTMDSNAAIEVAFFGGNFTAIPEKQQLFYLQLVEPYLSSGRIGGIRISTRPDSINAENLGMLKSHGVRTIELGVQSLDDEVLQMSARQYQAADVLESAALIQAYGFRLGLQLMIGLPGDTFERDMETTRTCIRIKPQMVRIYPTLVIAGTALEKLWRAGVYEPLSLEEAVNRCKDMLLAFTGADIPVIRMGLYPGEELRSPGTVQAGPFHPAFGELVEQAVFKEQAAWLIGHYLQQHSGTERLCLFVQERDQSKMLGPKRSNLAALCQRFGLVEIKLLTSPEAERSWIGIGPYESELERMRLTREAYIKERDIG